jgi:hypothetical protein
MRLVKFNDHGEPSLVERNGDNIPVYAILSHTWGADSEEVTYEDLIEGTSTHKTGYDKIKFCAQLSDQDGLRYFWIDTCCIDKSTSDELSTAINSMFRWYQHASKCYVYLSDVQVSDEVVDVQLFRITWEGAFRQSRWFTRGWTLQELLAPATVVFFSKESRQLGSKITLEREIFEITKIPTTALRGQPLAEFRVSERLSWAANRNTTMREDKIYCLLGIFGVFLPLIYGEGEDHASQRLEEEIQKQFSRKAWQDTDPQDLPIPTSSSKTPLKPSSNVPFCRDEDFVDRGNILARIDERCSRPAGRAALVGFGGFG